MSFKPEVVADSSGKFCDNTLRFATYEEALESARGLSDRWYMVTAYRAVESPDPVKHALVGGELRYIEEESTA